MSYGETTTPEIEAVASQIVDAAFRVHSKMGPGLLESAYEACLAYELVKCGLRVERQKPVPVVYDDVRLDVGFRIDLLVNDCVIVELKAVEKLLPIYEAQMITYLKLTGLRLGLLINFNVRMFKEGIRRIIR
jgi:GxxExxY protein